MTLALSADEKVFFRTTGGYMKFTGDLYCTSQRLVFYQEATKKTLGIPLTSLLTVVAPTDPRTITISALMPGPGGSSVEK